MKRASSSQFLFAHQKHIRTIKSVDIIKYGARFPAKKNGKMKKKLPSPKFNREIPKPRIMNPSAITYSSLNFKCDPP